MFSTPEFWVFIAFLLFLCIVGKKAYHFLAESLDAHSRKVAQQLEEAQRLHDEALSLLNSYKEKHKEAALQAEKIISFARAEAQELKKTHEHEFEKFMAQKEKSLLERIANDKEEAKSKIKTQIMNEALKIVKHVLSTKEEEKKKLTHAALQDVAKMPLKNR